MRTIAGLVTLLIATAISAGLLGCGSDSETVTETAVSTVTEEATDTVESTEGSVDTATDSTDEVSTVTTTDTGAPPVENLTAFQAPSGNIGCQLSAQSVRCDIRDHDYSDPTTPSDCPLDYGDSLSVGQSGPGEFVCHGDTAVDPSSPKAPYGSGAKAGPFTCRSEESGVTCTNSDTGHGFTLSRQEARPF